MRNDINFNIYFVINHLDWSDGIGLGPENVLLKVSDSMLSFANLSELI
jgi:hypothetical protein